MSTDGGLSVGDPRLGHSTLCLFSPPDRAEFDLRNRKLGVATSLRYKPASVVLPQCRVAGTGYCEGGIGRLSAT